MATVQVIAIVPAAGREAAEAAISAYLLSPNESGSYTFGVPLSGSGIAPATHYGTCAPIPDGGQMDAALPTLIAAFPGSDYHTVDVTSYSLQADWLDWLSAGGLRPVTQSLPG